MDRPTVLIIEDDQITRSFLFDILVHEGYDVALAEDGNQALEVLECTLPDLIISDIMMPEMSGVELFRRIQEQPRLQSLPFIFLTSLEDGESLIRVKELGPDDYISKPVRPRHLLATVKGKLRRKQIREEQLERDQNEFRERIRWTLSHELRTPLTIIQGISELLLTESQSSLGGDFQDLLQSLRSQAFQLGSLIENFLLVSRIDSGAEAENWRRGAALTSLGETIEEAAFPFRERARARGIDFQVSVPGDVPAVYVHRPHLIEILKQVLDNAFKFTAAAAPHVEIQARGEGREAVVTISDNGPGIPDDKRKVLFQKLAQVEREIHEQQGSGLGLYITKRLVDVNRGGIALKSEPGSGAEIEIRLPTAPPEEASAPPPSQTG